MSTINKIFTNTLWQVSAKIINIIIGVFSLALITRILGQEGFGFYTTIFAFVQMFMIVADLGLYLTLLREVSAAQNSYEENRAINNIFTIRVLASGLIVILIPLLVQLFPYSLVVKSGTIYFVLVFFCQSLISTLTAVFSKKFAMDKVAIVDFFNKVVYLIFLIYFFQTGANLKLILLSNSGVLVLGFLLLYIFLKKYVKLKLVFDRLYWRHIFKTTWPLAVTVILNLLYFKADTLILAAYHSPQVVALYGAPYKALEVLSTFPHMFLSLVFPLLTAAWLAKNLDKLKEIWQHSFDLFAMISVGLVAGTWLISKPAMIFLAGEDFAGSGRILNILVLATAVIFFGTLFTYMVVAIGEQKAMVKYFLITAIVGLLGYFLFIPRFAYWGAAYMTLAVEILLVIFAYYLVRRHVSIRLNYSVLVKSCVAALIMLLVVWPWKDFNIWLTIFVGAFIYLAFLYITRAINKQIIQELLNR